MKLPSWLRRKPPKQTITVAAEGPGKAARRTYFPSRHLACNPNTACAGALALRGQIIPVEDVQQLPLRGCRSEHCQCHYRVVDRHGRAI